MDTKKYLNDEVNWLNPQFHSMQYSAPNFIETTGMELIASIVVFTACGAD